VRTEKFFQEKTNRKGGKGVGLEYPLRSGDEITGRYFWHKIAGASWWSWNHGYRIKSWGN